jgi:hypothetical protein
MALLNELVVDAIKYRCLVAVEIGLFEAFL